MSTSFESCPGRFHIHVKLHGSEEHIRLFHAILKSVETDWQFGGHPVYHAHGRLQVCKKCKGLLVNSPRFNAADIKAAAIQAGVNVKIYNFAKESKCGGPSAKCQFDCTEFIDRKYGPVLYSHKPNRIQLRAGVAWVGEQPTKESTSGRITSLTVETVQ